MPQDASNIYDLIIIGAGPAGVEAALQAQAKGLSYLLLEKDDAGALIMNTMGNKKFLHVYGRNTATLKGLLSFPDHIMGDALVLLWREQVKSLAFQKGVTVQKVEKQNDQFTVHTNKGNFIGKKVLLTSGTFEDPRALGVPGELGNPNLFYMMDYYFDHAGKNVVVVGGGNSAVETACYLAPENSVVQIVRGPALATTVTPKNHEEHGEYIAEGKLKVFYNTKIEYIEPTKATAKNTSGEVIELPYDLFFVHAGFMQPLEFLEQVGVATENGKAVFNPTTFETNLPGLYIAGALTGADSVIESANQALAIVQNLTA